MQFVEIEGEKKKKKKKGRQYQLQTTNHFYRDVVTLRYCINHLRQKKK